MGSDEPPHELGWALEYIERRRELGPNQWGLLAPYAIRLLLASPPTWRADAVLADLRRELGPADRLPMSTPGTLAFGFRTKPVTSCFMHVNAGSPDGKHLEASLEQTRWPDARNAVAAAKFAVTVFDSTGLERVERVDRYQRLVRILLRHLDVIAIDWMPSGRIVDPVDYARPATPATLLHGPVNVRLFRGVDETGNENGMLLMDTLGLEAFGLPDLECRFSNLDPTAVATRLYEYADYVFTKGDVLEDGHTVDGIGGRWRCSSGVAFASPPRRVVAFETPASVRFDLDPWQTVNARCPVCGWRPDASARWECSCGFMWNTFDTHARCPACETVYAETQCLECGQESAHEDWYLRK